MSKPAPTPAGYMDERQAAFVLEVSPRALRGYRKLGAIGFHRLPGGRIRYTMDQLIDFQRSIRIAPRRA